MWIVLGPELASRSGRIAALDAEADLLRDHAERLEDKAWELRESDERHRSVIDALGMSFSGATTRAASSTPTKPFRDASARTSTRSSGGR
ncbi:hypothetical protein D1F64_01270 [Breoghania sp. L-A4]|nr:hypothetical protein D1F64_01270 [Breoghania sp. L-A4]